MIERKWLIVLHLAVCGALAAGHELVLSRMIAPFYGAGIDVWSGVLAAVLAGYMLGYFVGGWASNKQHSLSIAIIMMFGFAVLNVLQAMGAEFVLEAAFQTLGLNGGVGAAFLLGMPGILLLAAQSPIMVQLLAKEGTAGKTTGNLLALTTLAGTLGIFLFGFFLIPAAGVLFCQILVAIVATLLATLLAGLKGWSVKKSIGMASGGVLLALLPAFWASLQLPAHVKFKHLGILGELIVTDLPLEPEYGGGPRRMILNNRIAQTAVDPATGNSLWAYPHYLGSLLGLDCQNGHESGLLLGMAGGSVAMEMEQIGLQVDAVDIDPRMPGIARDFFGMPEAVQCFVDDARHFLNMAAKQYDVIVFDLFAGEGQPGHVFSLEAFQQVKRLLKPDGRLLINYHGFWEGEDGLGTRSVAKTLQEAGFQLHIVPTPGKPVERNLLMLGTLNRPDWQTCSQRIQNPCCSQITGNGHRRGFDVDPKMTADAFVLHDDQPLLDQLNAAAYRQWRQYAIDHYLLRLKTKGMRLY